MVMIKSSSRNDERGKRGNFQLAISSIRAKCDGESMLFDFNKTRRTGGREFFAKTERVGKEVRHS
jgi:hypothetical protein